MKKTMFIPTKLKVGFQERQDTFTGKLAYVTYYDEKNKLRKEASWTGWCREKLGYLELDNEPQSGFMLNKGVQRTGEWFSTGRSMIRVHDPRGFEFEISVENLIGILMHSDVSKRDIQQECVFAWHGTELVLLPTNAVEYQSSVEYTEKQSQKVSAKDLIKGCRYQQKKSEALLVYIGHLPWFDCVRYGKKVTNKGKKHIFYNGSSFAPINVASLSNLISDDIVSDYAELVDKFYDTHHSQAIVGVKFVPGVGDPTSKYGNTGFSYGYIFRQLSDTTFLRFDIYDYETKNSIEDQSHHQFAGTRTEFKIDKKVFEEVDGTREDYGWSSYGWANRTYRASATQKEIVERAKEMGFLCNQIVPLDNHTQILNDMKFGKLFLVLEDGTEVPYTGKYYI